MVNQEATRQTPRSESMERVTRRVTRNYNSIFDLDENRLAFAPRIISLRFRDTTKRFDFFFSRCFSFFIIRSFLRYSNLPVYWLNHLPATIFLVEYRLRNEQARKASAAT